MSICEYTIAHLNSFALTFSARSCLADKVQPPRPWQKSPVYCHIAENKEQGSKPVVISDFLDSSRSARVAQLVHFLFNSAYLSRRCTGARLSDRENHHILPIWSEMSSSVVCILTPAARAKILC